MKEGINRTPVNTVIAQAARNFKPNDDGWVGDAIGWIGDALAIIGVNSIMEPCTVTKSATEYRVKAPTCIETIIGIDSDGIPIDVDYPMRLTNTKTLSVGNCKLRGHFKGSWLHLNIEEAEVTFTVLAIPVNHQNTPLIPDNALLREALVWFILRQWIGQGNKHHTFSWADCDANWEKWWVRAANDMEFPTLLSIPSFANMWLNLVPNINQHNTNMLHDTSIAEYHYGIDNVGGFTTLKLTS